MPLPIQVSGPVLFRGDETSLTIGLLTGLRAVRPGQPLMVIDAANAFDPFLVATLARKVGLLPKALLDEIRISRVFTCHQLEALLAGRLQTALNRFGGRAVLFSGVLDALLDEEVPLKEATRIFEFIPPVLRQLAADGIMALCVCPPLETPPGRERFFAALQDTAAWIFSVSRGEESNDAIRIECIKPMTATWTWEPQIGMLVPRRWW